ncbi:DUF637 domain-containing protein, partial [Campylobacter sp. 9BO]|uniref:DUF637 domain-containing protein n=1 Tax=Campylobacter sp. 9BO TaxID=3424759 RepID=UPI003D351E2E
LKDATLANDNSSFLNFSTDNSLNFSYQNFTKAALNSISNAGINSAIYGTNFKDNLISNLAIQAGDSLYKSVGDVGVFKNLDDKSLTKIALHSLVGGSISAIQNQSFKDGAIISGLTQALAPLSSNTDTNKQFLSSQLIGILTGAILSGETGANQGYNLSTSAEQNNRQLHKEEIKSQGYDKKDIQTINIDPIADLLLDADIKLGGSKISGKNIKTTQNQIKELFNKDSKVNGITIRSKTYLAEKITAGPKGAKIFKGVSEKEIKEFFKQTAGVDKMPKAQKIFDKKSGEYKGIAYIVKGKNGEKFNLRNFSTSSLKDGSKPQWTLQINKHPSLKDKVELKFE